MKKGLHSEFPMTICIAAICDNCEGKNPKIVMAGDRMVTYGRTTQFEHKSPKLIEVAPNCVVATAGSVSTPPEILSDASISRFDEPVDIEEVGNKILKSFHKVRMREIENTILKVNLIDSAEDFIDKQQKMHKDYFEKIDGELDDFEFNVSIIIAGIDDRGVHLFKIDSGYEKLEHLTPLGYTWNGIGAIHAKDIFFSSEYYDKCPLNEALYTVYKAKKISEHAPGVGPKYIDLWVVTKSKIEKLDENMLNLLEKIYQKEQRAIKRSVKFESLDSSVKKLKL